MLRKSNFDKYHRYRDVTVAFRVSKGEAEMLNKMVKLSGMTKQGYIRNRLECKDVVVVGNPKVYKGLKTLLLETNNLLRECVRNREEPHEEIIELVEVIAKVLDDMKNETNN